MDPSAQAPEMKSPPSAEHAHPGSALFHLPDGRAQHPQDSVGEALSRFEALDSFAELLWHEPDAHKDFLEAVRWFHADLERLYHSVGHWFRQNHPEHGLLGEETKEARRQRAKGES